MSGLVLACAHCDFVAAEVIEFRYDGANDDRVGFLDTSLIRI